MPLYLSLFLGYVGFLILVLVVAAFVDFRRKRVDRQPTPIGDILLLRPIERPAEINGMARPDMQAEMPSEGVVLLAGPGRIAESGMRQPMQVRVGDTVSFPPYAGKAIVDPLGMAPGIYLLVRQDELFLNHHRQPYPNRSANE